MDQIAHIFTEFSEGQTIPGKQQGTKRFSILPMTYLKPVSFRVTVWRLGKWAWQCQQAEISLSH